MILFFSLSWVSAKEAPEPKPQPWQIDGIMAALDDGYPNVQGLAFLKSIEELRKLNFQGVCFLIDGAEFIVRQSWASDAWSYLRGLKDTDTAIKPFLGLLLSGYRDLKEYQQRVGSPLLNIAEVEWLASLSDEETSIVDWRSRRTGKYSLES